VPVKDINLPADITVSTSFANAGPVISAAFATTGAATLAPLPIIPIPGISDAIPAAIFINFLLPGLSGPSL